MQSTFLPLLNGVLKLFSLVFVVLTCFSVTIDSYDATHIGLAARAVALVAALAGTMGWLLLWKIGDWLFRQLGSPSFGEWVTEIARG